MEWTLCHSTVQSENFSRPSVVASYEDDSTAGCSGEISIIYTISHSETVNFTLFFFLIQQISANNGIRLTYQELHTQSVRAAQNIQKLNFKKGDIFMIISNNNHELTPIVTALLATGYAYNALDPSFTETEITHMVNIIKPKLVFSDLQSYDAIEKSLRNLNIEAPVYTFEGQVGNSIAVQSLLAKTGQEYEFV